MSFKMNDKLFNQLVLSLNEAIKVANGELVPGKITVMTKNNSDNKGKCENTLDIYKKK